MSALAPLLGSKRTSIRAKSICSLLALCRAPPENKNGAVTGAVLVH
jgi:hypothetical protein